MRLMEGTLLQEYRDVKSLLEFTISLCGSERNSQGVASAVNSELRVIIQKIHSLQLHDHCPVRKESLKETCSLLEKQSTQNYSEDDGKSAKKKQKVDGGALESEASRKKAIEATIICPGDAGFSNVAGLAEAKRLLKEAVVMPLKYPHLFAGQRKPWKGILLFGAPGTGKSQLARAVSAEVRAPFYSVAGSDLLSSWFGESEKMIKELFKNARSNSKRSVIFIDEIDGLCRKRNSNEQEHTRGVKTELLKQMEGVSSGEDSDVFVLGATNCPWELDTAFLRRFEKRIHIPLPDEETRKELFDIQLKSFPISVDTVEWQQLLRMSEGYSGSDISTCIADALFEPIRELENSSFWKWNTDGKTVSPCQESEEGAVKIRFESIAPEQVKPRIVSFQDIRKALAKNHRTISDEEIRRYEEFTTSFGQRA